MRNKNGLIMLSVFILLLSLVTLDFIRILIKKESYSRKYKKILRENVENFLDHPLYARNSIAASAAKRGITLSAGDILIDDVKNEFGIEKYYDIRTFILWLLGKPRISIFTGLRCAVDSSDIPASSSGTVYPLLVEAPGAVNYNIQYELTLLDATPASLKILGTYENAGEKKNYLNCIKPLEVGEKISYNKGVISGRVFDDIRKRLAVKGDKSFYAYVRPGSVKLMIIPLCLPLSEGEASVAGFIPFFVTGTAEGGFTGYFIRQRVAEGLAAGKKGIKDYGFRIKGKASYKFLK